MACENGYSRFAVCEFQDDGSLEVILTSWLNTTGTQCLFPTDKRAFVYRRILLNRSPLHELNHEKSWNMHKIRVMEYFKTYASARDYLKNMINSSKSLEKSGDNKKLRVKRKLSSSPVRKEENEEVEERQLVLSEDETPCNMLDYLGFPKRSSTTKKPRKSTPKSEEGCQNCKEKEILSALHSLHIIVADLVKEVRELKDTLKNNERNNELNDLAKEVRELKDKLKDDERNNELNDLAKELRELKDKLKDDERNNELNAMTEITLLQKLPLNNEEAFEEVESLLQESKVSSLLTNILARVGGRDSRFMTYLCLKRALTSELAQKFSFTGKPPKGKVDAVKKRPFRSTNLYKCLKAAVMECYPSDKESELQTSVSSWLQQAKRRLQ